MATLRDYEAHHVKMFLEENWSEFVSNLKEDYDDEAEEIAEEIVNKLKCPSPAGFLLPIQQEAHANSAHPVSADNGLA